MTWQNYVLRMAEPGSINQHYVWELDEYIFLQIKEVLDGDGND